MSLDAIVGTYKNSQVVPDPLSEPPLELTAAEKAARAELDRAEAKARAIGANAAELVAQATRQEEALLAEAKAKSTEIMNRGLEAQQKALLEASQVEDKALDAAGALRSCVELGCTELAGDFWDFTPVVQGDDLMYAMDHCWMGCEADAHCKQAVFAMTSGTPRCKLYSERSEVPITYDCNFVSAYCGPKSEKHELSEKADKVHELARKLAWTCHTYTDLQDSEWCDSVGVFGDNQFMYAGDAPDMCGGCDCCTRPNLPGASTVGEILAALAQQPRSPPNPSAEVAQAQQDVKRMVDEANDDLDWIKDTAHQVLRDARERAEDIVGTNEVKLHEMVTSAQSAEEKGLKKMASVRRCWDLIGVAPKATEPVRLRSAAKTPDLTTLVQCRFWCQAHTECKMMVFTRGEDGNSHCDLYGEINVEAADFGDNYNASFCGSPNEDMYMEAYMDQVYLQKPWSQPAANCSWADHDCSATRCCAQPCEATKDFASCTPYSCVQKNSSFATCISGSTPLGWDGTRLGGHDTQEVSPASDGMLTAGYSLYCFCVIRWPTGAQPVEGDGEAMVVENWRNRGLSIMQCDEHDFFDVETSVSVDPYTDAWRQVQEHDRWRFHDWTVKVDGDAVFFPDRLRMHINMLQVPRHATVYLRNSHSSFHFREALQVLSKAAMRVFFSRFHGCESNLAKIGALDYWFYQCLEGVGIHHVSSLDMLVDLEVDPRPVGGCVSDYTVAFTPYLSVKDWNECHDRSQTSWNHNHPEAVYAMM